MQNMFLDLCDFFGITSLPANFAEFAPWLFQVLLAIGLFVFVFSIIKAFVTSFGRGRW